MTTISIPREVRQDEHRIAMVPSQVGRLIKLGARVQVESGLGTVLAHSDEDYVAEGAVMEEDREVLLGSADLVLSVGGPCKEELGALREGTIYVGFLDPFNQRPLLDELGARRITAISMELIPRITRAQKLDALTSQANLAGYVAVIIAANHLNRILPMMTTAAGTISPARVLVIGAGVAGLQAIATAHRLGARVEAFDSRPVVEEQVKSLGARFVKIDVGESGETSQGYARELTEVQKVQQRAGLTQICSRSDIVITTAQVFGRKAPLLVTSAMLEVMRPGSVVVDLAVESGGNVEGSVLGQTVELGGVKVVGQGNLPGHVAANASQVYTANIVNLVDEFWDKEEKLFGIDLKDEILGSSVVTHDGRVRFGEGSE